MDILEFGQARKSGIEGEITKMIKKMDKQGKNINEISNRLVYDVQISPEFAWRMIRKTLKLNKVI
jgi:hypothetical protein